MTITPDNDELGRHFLNARVDTDAGIIAVCSCGWASKPRPTRGGAWRSFNAHGNGVIEARQVELDRKAAR